MGLKNIYFFLFYAKFKNDYLHVLSKRFLVYIIRAHMKVSCSSYPYMSRVYVQYDVAHIKY